MIVMFMFVFFFQAEDGIRDLVRSRGLGDVYKRQGFNVSTGTFPTNSVNAASSAAMYVSHPSTYMTMACLLYTSDAADERSSVDLGGRRIIQKKIKRSIVGI